MQTGRWVPVGRSQKPEMEVKGLQEGHEYKFRVKAVNDEGESEPLETERSIVAKNPYGKFFFNNCALLELGILGTGITYSEVGVCRYLNI